MTRTQTQTRRRAEAPQEAEAGGGLGAAMGTWVLGLHPPPAAPCLGNPKTQRHRPGMMFSKRKPLPRGAGVLGTTLVAPVGFYGVGNRGRGELGG